MKKVLLYILFAFLFAPIIQGSFKLVDESVLMGSFTTAPDTTFSPEAWLSGEYQQQKEKYLNEHFGFRRTMVRIYNEYRYRLFHMSTNAEVVFGNNNMLFAEAYIDSYTGKDYIGNEKIRAVAKQLKKDQDSLKAWNIVLLPVLAPNKARIYKEFIPDQYPRPGKSNYEDLTKAFKNEGVQFIDFNSLFQQMRDTAPYILFSPYGIHWSAYGHSLAADSIIVYVEKERGEKLPSFSWKDQIEQSDRLRGLDYDIAGAMNLFTTQLPAPPMPYPRYSFGHSNRKRPSLLVIGDSFYFGIQDTKVQEKVFSNEKFIYYFAREQKPGEGEKMSLPTEADKEAMRTTDLLKLVRSYDVILILCTEHSLDTFGWGFVERLDAILSRDPATKAAEEKIRNNPEWMLQISQKARERGVSIDEMVTMDALYTLSQEKQKK
ncbi:MAG: sugar O-acetyltransferase precursor [Bacteroidetes bacterium]|jgi:hypothetical protein|nr:sugar O-acetyltransferase precursor [Bacteroidota bacterium]